MTIFKSRGAWFGLSLGHVASACVGVALFLCPPSISAADPTPSPPPTAPAQVQAPPSPLLPGPEATLASGYEDRAPAVSSVDPLTPNLWYSIQDEYTPSFDSTSGSSNQINLQAQLPLGRHKKLPQFFSLGHMLNLIKFKLPLTSYPPTGGASSVIAGVGDMTVTSLAIFGSVQRRWAAGPIFKFPTGSSSGLGSGKWTIGPALGYTFESTYWTLGVYTKSFFSYAGTGSKPPVAQTEIEPTLAYNFPHGWSVGNSDMAYTYDYELGAFTNAPIGMRINKQFKMGDRRLSTEFQAEKNLAHVDGAPAWILRLEFKWILPNL